MHSCWLLQGMSVQILCYTWIPLCFPSTHNAAKQVPFWRRLDRTSLVFRQTCLYDNNSVNGRGHRQSRWHRHEACNRCHIRSDSGEEMPPAATEPPHAGAHIAVQLQMPSCCCSPVSSTAPVLRLLCCLGRTQATRVELVAPHQNKVHHSSAETVDGDATDTMPRPYVRCSRKYGTDMRGLQRIHLLRQCLEHQVRHLLSRLCSSSCFSQMYAVLLAR